MRHVNTHAALGPGATQNHIEQQQQSAGVPRDAHHITKALEDGRPHVEVIGSSGRRETVTPQALGESASAAAGQRKRSIETRSSETHINEEPTWPRTRRRNTSEDSGRTG